LPLYEVSDFMKMSKFGGRTAANFSRPNVFSGAGFELLCRIFGRLATVLPPVGLREIERKVARGICLLWRQGELVVGFPDR